MEILGALQKRSTSPFLVIIIEDVQRQLDALSTKIEGVLDDSIDKSNIRFEKFLTKSEYDNFTDFKDIEKVVLVTDIKLSEHRDREGVEIIKNINTKFYDSENHAIVHTTSKDLGLKSICEELGVKDYFVKKLDDEMEEYISATWVAERVKKIVEEISNKPNPSIKKENNPSPTLQLDTGNLDKNQYSVHQIKSDVEDIDIKFDKLTFQSKLYILSLLLYPVEQKSYAYVEKQLWSVEPVGDTKNLNSNAIQIDLYIGAAKSIKSLHILRNMNKIVEMGDVDMGHYLIYNFKEDEIITFLKDNSTIEAFLTEYFFAKKLARLCLDKKLFGDDTRKEEDFAVIDVLSVRMKRYVFLVSLWEWMTKTQTKNSDKTKKALKEISDHCDIEIDDMFYCELEEVDGESAKVKVVSVENRKIRFYRNFLMKYLKKNGIEDLNTRFMLILHSSKTDTDNLGDRQLLLRIPHYNSL